MSKVASDDKWYMGFWIGHLHKMEQSRIREGQLNPHEREMLAKGADPWAKFRGPLPVTESPQTNRAAPPLKPDSEPYIPDETHELLGLLSNAEEQKPREPPAQIHAPDPNRLKLDDAIIEPSGGPSTQDLAPDTEYPVTSDARDKIEKQGRWGTDWPAQSAPQQKKRAVQFPPPTAEKPKLGAEFYVGLCVGFIPWGLNLIGITINLWLGVLILAISFALLARAFWVWERARHWPKGLRILTVGLALVFSAAFVTRQIARQQREAPVIAPPIATPSPVVSPMSVTTPLPLPTPTPTRVSSPSTGQRPSKQKKECTWNEKLSGRC